jgi:hypothetical protein
MLGAVADGVHLRAAVDLAWRVFVFASPLIAMQIVQHRTGRLDIVLGLSPPLRGAIYAAWVLAIITFGQFQGNEFIYFQF